MDLPIRRNGLDRQTPFSFKCSQCLACCKGKKIQVNPYEIARLAANRGMSTTAFIATYTAPGGTVLNCDHQGNCVFLETGGCSVHQDRPLVCRLYPLGRSIHPSGQESFSEIAPETACQGIAAPTPTIAAYLEDQDAAPYVQAAETYLELFWSLLDTVHEHTERREQRDAIIAAFQMIPTSHQNHHNNSWLDMDAAVTRYCATNQLELPATLEDKMQIHIQALKAWTSTMTGGPHE